MASEQNANAENYSKDECELADRLLVENYELLKTIARAKRRRARIADTMMTTDILHESYLKLRDKDNWLSSEHYIRASALAMRHVIVDYARKKLTQKRASAGNIPIEDSESLLPEFFETPEEVVAISQLLEQLQTTNPRWMRVVDARYFSGMTEEETAKMLGVSERTVRRDWRDARDWMAAQMGVERS